MVAVGILNVWEFGRAVVMQALNPSTRKAEVG